VRASAAPRPSAAAYAGMLLFGIAMALLGSVLPALSERLRVDLAQIGTLFLVMNLCILATSFALGPLMDRYGTKPPLVLGPLLVGAALARLATAGHYGDLVGGVGLLGVGGGAVNGAGNTLVADLHDDPQSKSAALNLLGVFFGIGALLLPFAIGLLLEAMGLGGILLAAAALCLLIAAHNAALRFPAPKQAERLPLREAARFLRDPVVILFGAMLFFQSANEFIVGGYVSTFLTREIGSSVRAASWVVAAYWAGLMLARVALSRVALRVPGPRIVIGSALAAAVGLAVLASARQAELAVAATVFVGTALSGIFPTALGMVGARYAAYTGTVFGLLFTAALTGGVTLPWLIGQVAQERGLRTALAFVVVTFLAVAALQWAAARRMGSGVVAVLALGAAPLFAQTVGERLPRWTAGMLDIHHINTGRGNAALLMLPDGTTLLIDAGDGGHRPPRGTPPRPDASRPTGEWIARYARAMGASALDYGYITHFHDDHMDAMVDVAERIEVRRMLDRGWPDYDYPSPEHAEFRAPAFLRYRELLARGAVKGERLQPGRRDQIVLAREPQTYPEFEIRNIAANGEVWTGVGDQARRHFPALEGLDRQDWPTENMCSLAIRLRYGRFDYFSGGDMPGNLRPGYPDWQDVETPVARAVGPVDVAVLNHHGNRDSTNAFLVGALRPRVWVIPVWSSDHPGHDVLDRMYAPRLYPGPRDVFATNMIEANRIVIGPLLDRLASAQGHVVIRVARGGASYHVIVLDDASESYAVKAVHGPYDAR